MTIYDDTDFALTYEGTVRRVASSFLPKRGADVALTVNPTKVLEVVIEVADPAPADKPAAARRPAGAGVVRNDDRRMP